MNVSTEKLEAAARNYGKAVFLGTQIVDVFCTGEPEALLTEEQAKLAAEILGYQEFAIHALRDAAIEFTAEEADTAMIRNQVNDALAKTGNKLVDGKVVPAVKAKVKKAVKTKKAIKKPKS